MGAITLLPGPLGEGSSTGCGVSAVRLGEGGAGKGEGVGNALLLLRGPAATAAPFP